ncbi:MAG TPA: TIM barrel protein [Chitinophagaceae bacterium]|nr:TIM barrel protein [Chitinophagaceae bacterium]
MKKQTTRREFLGTTGLLLSGIALGGKKIWGAPAYIPDLGKNRSLIRGVQIGVITYSFRDLPDQSAEATLKYIVDAGLGATELMGGPAESFAGAPKNPVDFRTLFPLMRKRYNKEQLTEDEEKTLADADKQRQAYQQELAQWRLKAPMAKFKELRRMFEASGVHIYAFKPDTFGKQNSDAEIDYGFRAAKLLGASHVTVEHPGNDAMTLKLGQMAVSHGMRVAYHGHEQQTPTLWDTALSQSPGNYINVDLGHFVAAGNTDPLGFLRQKHDRIASMHLKDRTTPAHGKGNLPWGQGDTPIREALQLMRDQKYRFPGTIELEYEVPKDSDPVSEVKKCLAYCRTALG